MARIARIILTSLSLFLGMFFFFFGLIKVSRTLNSDIHREMRRNFVRYAKVVPLISTHFGWKVSPRVYRLLVGYSEIITGLLLAFFPGRIKQLVNVFLIFMTMGAIYTHLAIGDDYNKMIPAIAFCSMLTTRLILNFLLERIDYQTKGNTATIPRKFDTSYSETLEEKDETINAKSNKLNYQNQSIIERLLEWSFGMFRSNKSSTTKTVPAMAKKTTKRKNKNE